MKLLIGFLFVAFVAYLLFLAFNHFFGAAARDNRVSKKDMAKSLTAARNRERIATKALRQVANGSGAPILEAQIALDEIENTYEYKEIQ